MFLGAMCGGAMPRLLRLTMNLGETMRIHLKKLQD
jgi:hypothetical protein